VRDHRTIEALAGGPEAGPLFELDHIGKRFGSLWANQDISLSINSGEIHAVIGENGAGKSTLMRILYGLLMPDTGTISLYGRPIVFRHPRAAMAAGIGMVHQQLLIFPQLTALENIIVGAEPKQWGRFALNRARPELDRLCNLFGFDLALDAQACELSFAQRQQIELLRILYRKATVLILDEPTSLLAPPEIDRLLGLLKSLKQQGRSIIFISHRLEEVFSIADRITVLRQGRLVVTTGAGSTSMKEMAGLIVSPSAPPSLQIPEGAIKAGNGPVASLPGSIPQESAILELREVSTPSSDHEVGLTDFSLSVRTNEILAIGGIVGNGHRTLARLISGLLSPMRGTLLFADQDITGYSIKERLRQGIRWLPANPLDEMALPDRSLWENLLLGRERQPVFQSRGVLLLERIKPWAVSELTAHEVSFADVEQPIGSLSGGNLQKLALAHTLADSPRLVVLEQPGRGLDLGARARLYQHIRTLNARGVTFIIISYDLDELLTLAHRIAILFRGRLMGVMPGEEVSRETLGLWMLGEGGNHA